MVLGCVRLGSSVLVALSYTNSVQCGKECVQKFVEFFDVPPIFVQFTENSSPLKAFSCTH